MEKNQLSKEKLQERYNQLMQFYRQQLESELKQANQKIELLEQSNYDLQNENKNLQKMLRQLKGQNDNNNLIDQLQRENAQLKIIIEKNAINLSKEVSFCKKSNFQDSNLKSVESKITLLKKILKLFRIVDQYYTKIQNYPQNQEFKIKLKDKLPLFKKALQKCQNEKSNMNFNQDTSQNDKKNFTMALNSTINDFSKVHSDKQSDSFQNSNYQKNRTINHLNHYLIVQKQIIFRIMIKVLLKRQNNMNQVKKNKFLMKNQMKLLFQLINQNNLIIKYFNFLQFNMKIIFILNFFLLNFKFTNQLQDINVPKDNLILDFHYESLNDFISKYKYVIVYFNDVQTRWGKKNQKKFINIANEMKTTEIVFLQIQTNQLNDKILQQYKKQYSSRLNFYIYNFQKEFHQRINEEQVINWITNIYTSQVIQYENIEKLQTEINFTYISKKWYDKNKVHLDILAKLIFPVKIFTDFPKEILDVLKVDSKLPLWLLQSYSNKVLKIDINLDINDKAKFIMQNEFPNYMYANQNSYKILFDLKIPSAIYFTKQPKKDKHLTILKKISKKYKEYFLLTIVDIKKKNFETKFFKKFMGIKKKVPQLRILNMTDKVQRYKFHGKYKESLIENFYYNYIHENLKPFKLNQSIQYNEKLYGIMKANHKMFQKMLKDENITYVIFVYGQNTKYLVRQLEELDIVQDILRNNKTLKFYCIDHDQNDLDGYYNDQLPFLFISDRLGKLHHYEEGQFEADKMLVFINSNVPYLENSDPSFEFATGDLQLIFLNTFYFKLIQIIRQ